MNTKTRFFSETVPYILFGFSSVFTIIILAGIFLFLFFTSWGAFNSLNLRDFFFGLDWNPTSFHAPSWGIFSLILGTLMVTALAIVIVVPFGLAMAIYIAEIASSRNREFVKPLIEMIASIPSVVLGIVGLLFVAPVISQIFHISNGLNALTASILVAVAALPTVTSILEDALSSVSYKLREASYALGATKWMTIRKIVIPAALSGVIAAIMLGLGRIIGETMIVLMVAGNSRALPHSFLDPVRPLTANIAIEIKEVVVGSLHWKSLFAIAVVLFMLTFMINFLADLLLQRTQSE